MNKLIVNLLLVALTATLAVQAAEMSKEEAKAKLMEFGKDCAVEVGATSEDIDVLMKKEAPETQTGKCMVNCIYKKLGLMKDGKYNSQGAIDITAKLYGDNAEIMEKAKKITAACEGEAKGADECEIATNAMSCGIKMAKEHGIHTEIPV